MTIKLSPEMVVAAIIFFAAAVHSSSSVSAPADRCLAIAPTVAAANGTGTVSTTVHDAATGRPLAGAIINWSFGQHAMTGSTDDKGRFVFQLPIADREKGDRVLLTLKSNGYASQTIGVRECPGINPPLALALMPIARFGTVEGQVTNPATGRGIPNATIAILMDKYPAVGLSTGVRPWGRAESGRWFDRLPGVVIFKLCRAEIAERRV